MYNEPVVFPQQELGYSYIDPMQAFKRLTRFEQKRIIDAGYVHKPIAAQARELNDMLALTKQVLGNLNALFDKTNQTD